jgi:hypothetical protein
LDSIQASERVAGTIHDGWLPKLLTALRQPRRDLLAPRLLSEAVVFSIQVADSVRSLLEDFKDG